MLHAGDRHLCRTPPAAHSMISRTLFDLKLAASSHCGVDPEILGAVLSLFLSLRPRGCAIDVGRLAGGNATLNMFSHTWKDFDYDMDNLCLLLSISSGMGA